MKPIFPLSLLVFFAISLPPARAQAPKEAPDGAGDAKAAAPDPAEIDRKNEELYKKMAERLAEAIDSSKYAIGGLSQLCNKKHKDAPKDCKKVVDGLVKTWKEFDKVGAQSVKDGEIDKSWWSKDDNRKELLASVNKVQGDLADANKKFNQDEGGCAMPDFKLVKSLPCALCDWKSKAEDKGGEGEAEGDGSEMFE